MAEKRATGGPAAETGQAGGASFDERLARLEGIVSEMESGELGLEASLERYREGISLLKQCHGVLASYRQQVEELSADAEGGLRPFGEDPDAREDGAGR